MYLFSDYCTKMKVAVTFRPSVTQKPITKHLDVEVDNYKVC